MRSKPYDLNAVSGFKRGSRLSDCGQYIESYYKLRTELKKLRERVKILEERLEAKADLPEWKR